MKLTEQEKLNYYILRTKAPKRKEYGDVDKLIGNMGKLKVTRTYIMKNDDASFSDKTIESYLLVKGERNNMIAIDRVPYLDLYVEDGMIKAKDVEEIVFDSFGNRYVTTAEIPVDDNENTK